MKFITVGDYSIIVKEMFFLVPQRPLESSKKVSTIASIEKQDTRAFGAVLGGYFVQCCPRNITR